MSYFVCFLEEPSAKEMLKGILPRIIPDHVLTEFIVFEGKQDMEKQIERRLRYWKKPNSVFLIMRDKDAGDCLIVKQNLIDKVMSAGKIDSSIVRIACHELESFYLGDLEAVEKGLSITGLGKKQNNKKFRNPDKLASPSNELLIITKRNIYQKISGSRAIAPYLDLGSKNKSHSFKILLEGINSLVYQLRTS